MRSWAPLLHDGIHRRSLRLLPSGSRSLLIHRPGVHLSSSSRFPAWRPPPPQAAAFRRHLPYSRSCAAAAQPSGAPAPWPCRRASRRTQIRPGLRFSRRRPCPNAVSAEPGPPRAPAPGFRLALRRHPALRALARRSRRCPCPPRQIRPHLRFGRCRLCVRWHIRFVGIQRLLASGSLRHHPACRALTRLSRRQACPPLRPLTRGFLCFLLSALVRVRLAHVRGCVHICLPPVQLSLS